MSTITLPANLPTILAGLTIIFVFAMALYPSSLLRWFQRKRYQYEVTFALYMLTPTEKFIFNSILFLLLSMVSIAIALYLPRHVSVIAHRAYYYLSGELSSNATISKPIESIASSTISTAVEAVTQAVAPEL